MMSEDVVFKISQIFNAEHGTVGGCFMDGLRYGGFLYSSTN